MLFIVGQLYEAKRSEIAKAHDLMRSDQNRRLSWLKTNTSAMSSCAKCHIFCYVVYRTLCQNQTMPHHQSVCQITSLLCKVSRDMLLCELYKTKRKDNMVRQYFIHGKIKVQTLTGIIHGSIEFHQICTWGHLVLICTESSGWQSNVCLVLWNLYVSILYPLWCWIYFRKRKYRRACLSSRDTKIAQEVETIPHGR